MAGQYRWHKTNAPVASSRTDDIFFIDPDRGWAVNSNGQILKTEDGWAHWNEQLRIPKAYLRCVGFANASKGWVGTLTRDQRLWSTKDGGTTWTRIDNLPNAPSAICGLSVVNESVVYASGTNYPNRPAGIIKTTDGGQTWAPIDMSQHASLLVDIYFADPIRGWVVGGKADVANPSRDDVKAVVLYTEDGGNHWVNTAESIAATLPKGEWGWKIFFLNDTIGFVSLENLNAGAVLNTLDGGRTWTRHAVNDQQHNANLEGVGFVDENQGWVGGWGSADFSGGFSSETRDGGNNWANADEIGRFLNRFRFFHSPKLVGYASGDTVYRYDDSDVALGLLPATHAQPIAVVGRTVEIPYTVNAGDTNLSIEVWDRFGEHVGSVKDEENPVAGAAVANWTAPAAGFFIYRVSTNRTVESRIVRVR
jgi:photosystem II stability/assembly factor-like uncharacterized protein